MAHGPLPGREAAYNKGNMQTTREASDQVQFTIHRANVAQGPGRLGRQTPDVQGEDADADAPEKFQRQWFHSNKPSLNLDQKSYHMHRVQC